MFINSQSAIYASRILSRRRFDVRARLVAVRSTGERIVVHARTRDLSCSGAGVTLTGELPSGTEVTLYMRIPGEVPMLCLRAVVTRCRGFRAGLQFVQPSARQRLLLSELCYA
jgi:hypothetical protein